MAKGCSFIILENDNRVKNPGPEDQAFNDRINFARIDDSFSFHPDIEIPDSVSTDNFQFQLLKSLNVCKGTFNALAI